MNRKINEKAIKTILVMRKTIIVKTKEQMKKIYY